MSEISRLFNEQSYYLARGVYSSAELKHLDLEFDRVVDQISASNEDINARWPGPEMEILKAQLTVVFHTHNIHQYSGLWHRDGFGPNAFGR